MSDRPDQRRDHGLLLKHLQDRLPGYLPQWQYDQAGPAHALLQIAARYLERLDQAKHNAMGQSQLAFLDGLGERRLPAQAAEAAVVFTLSDAAQSDMAVAAGSVIQATPPQTPNRVQSFSTLESLTITRAKMAGVYSMVPGQDFFADHSNSASTGFEIFSVPKPIEHSIYLGSALFNLPAQGCDQEEGQDDLPQTLLRIRFDFRRLATDIKAPKLRVRWEFYGGDDWYPLEQVQNPSQPPSDTFFDDELVVLRKDFGPASKKTEVLGHQDYWIRARLDQPLPDTGTDGRGGLPVVDRIFAATESALSGLLVDEAVGVGRALDISGPFYPFDRVPKTHDVFYFACREAFSRAHARIRIRMSCKVPLISDANPKLIWEYFNGRLWDSLQPSETPDSSTNPYTYTFVRPTDWTEAEVNGSSNYWVRIRIAQGNFGQPVVTFPVVQTTDGTTTTTTTLIDPATDTTTGTGKFVPPVIEGMSLSYSHVSPTTAVRVGVVSNDFLQEDVSAALGIPGRTFRPFRRAGPEATGLYLAFDRLLPSGLVSLFAHVLVDVHESPLVSESRFVWEYWSHDGWQTLSVRDRTLSFQQSGTLQFVGPWDAMPSPGLGGSLYRIRARLKEGQAADPIKMSGLWLNATTARQQRRYPQVLLGQSNGNPEQQFTVAKSQLPVLANQVLEIREWAKSSGEAPPFLQDLPSDHTRVINEPASGKPKEIWVRWQEVDSLLNSEPDERSYTIDRVTGVLRFGDGTYGRIPPPGSRLALTYHTGGGLEGNVPRSTIRQPLVVVPGLESVDNPRSATGGAPSEPLQDTLRRGPKRLRHGDRAITESDYEYLAQEASRAVARARCLPLTGSAGGGQRGWVTVIVIPHSHDPQPMPDAAMRRQVRQYLSRKVPAPIAKRVRVVVPAYAPVSIAATILPQATADLTDLEHRVREALDRFLHPLRGGLDGNGWRMGQPIYLSQIAQVIETEAGVDKALLLRMHIDGNEQGEKTTLAPHLLPATGAHELSFQFEETC